MRTAKRLGIVLAATVAIVSLGLGAEAHAHEAIGRPCFHNIPR